MANISSYPIITPKPSDLVLVVQTYLAGVSTETGNPTKTARVSDFLSLGVQSLTTVGTSGAATLNAGVLNIPTPSVSSSPFTFNASSTTGIESSSNTASGDESTAIGRDTLASGFGSTAMGSNTEAIGSRSTAMGYDTTASAEFSTAMGKSTTASGNQSTAMGESTDASGTASTAIGKSTTASGAYSTAMGNGTTASESNSTAMGANSTASGTVSTAMGNATAASGFASTAMGYQTDASGSNSTAIGRDTLANGNYSTAMGRDTESSGDNSTAMGKSTTASGFGSTAIGQHNVLNSGDAATSFNLTNTALSIGNGTSSAARSDAFSVLFNGNTTVAGSVTAESLNIAALNAAPASASATGTIGEIKFTADHIYVCVDDNTWRRVAIATF